MREVLPLLGIHRPFGLAEFRRGLDRVRELGWFVKVFGFEDDFLFVADELRKIDFPAIIDHMGGPDYRRGTGQPAVRLILDLLNNGNWWIGLSNGDLRSHTGYPWDDAVEFGRLFYEAAPDRCLRIGRLGWSGHLGG